MSRASRGRFAVPSSDADVACADGTSAADVSVGPAVLFALSLLLLLLLVMLALFEGTGAGLEAAALAPKDCGCDVGGGWE